MRKIANKYFEGHATDAELKKLLGWLRVKDNKVVFNEYRSDWENGLESDRFPCGGEESWNHLQSKLWQKSYGKWQNTIKIYHFFRYAAIFLFVLAIGSLVLYFSNRPTKVSDTYTRVIAENGQISKVSLPDGSLVWLNSGSEISYDNLFSSKNRRVTLTGEAYFNIVTNEEIPLIVDCGELQVKVFGTTFNVNAYNWEEDIEVVLEKGKVELVNPVVNSTIYRINPGERVRFDKEDKKLAVADVNTYRYISWKNGMINFYDLSIEEVVRRLETRYNQKFELEPAVKYLRYTFTIKNEPLHEILRLMERITPVDAEQKDDVIAIRIDKDKMRNVEGK
jgi:transmembrane sensor